MSSRVVTKEVEKEGWRSVVWYGESGEGGREALKDGGERKEGRKEGAKEGWRRVGCHSKSERTMGRRS